MKKKFVILCYPRTGSYLLVDLLNKQDDVVCHGEIFKPNWIELEEKYLAALNINSMDIEQRNKTPLMFMNGVYQKTEASCVGFKLFANHNYRVRQNLLFNNSDIKKIFLARNPFQSLVSQRLAEQTGKWTKKVGEEEQQFKKIKIEVSDIVEHMMWMKNFYEIVLAADKLSNNNSFCFIDYSELFEQDRLNELGAFIGLGSWNYRIESVYSKQLNSPYSEIIDNWKDVQRALENLGINEHTPFFRAMAQYNSTLYSK